MTNEVHRQRRISKMGISEGPVYAERLTRSECKVRDARLRIIGDFLCGTDANDWRHRAQAVLDARLLPDEWAARLEGLGAALWHYNRSVLGIFAQAGCEHELEDYLDDEHESIDAFNTAVLELGDKFLAAGQRRQLLEAVKSHEEAFKAAQSFSERFSHLQRSHLFPTAEPVFDGETTVFDPVDLVVARATSVLPAA